MKNNTIEIQMELFFQEAAKHDIEAIIKLANIALKGRFRKPKKPKYGHLSKYLPAEVFQQILEALPNDKLRFTFYIIKSLALRIGELPLLNINNLDLDKRQILIPCTEKSHMPDICYFNDEIAEKLKCYVDENYYLIKHHSGYLFYPDETANSRRENISPDYLRNKFREACKNANVQINYGIARNSGYQLNLYTTHSLRHTGITDFYCKTKDLHLTMMYARHQDINSTLHYIHQSQQELKEAVMSLNYKASIMDDLRTRLELLESLLKYHKKPLEVCVED